ncbi:hypothetical protein EIL87_18835 [Saccharopolyspora rhizosphaerae]|uniref:DUF6286 domain-containing protein n=1 Tax=Saccharopolyspora rhizosphaerae TaxID=2492662 RepID=A0A3R8P1W0_9PSEU|nr:DUF6286 domain-containing protein [Saccharopolyspora rhizosphaerae]RRO14790.1 hypothetical protein EIL87_18835 [Saccharopolyspora rhizosphaerae]
MRLFARLITALAGLVVAAAGTLLAVEAAWALVRPRSPGLIFGPAALRDALSGFTWTSPTVRAVAIALVVLGAVLLVVAITAGHRDLRLHDPAPEVTVTTDRRSLARLVGHQVRDQDGVAGATVTAGAKRVRVKAAARFRESGDLRQRLTSTAERAVGDLPLPRAPKVLVSVEPPEERR